MASEIIENIAELFEKLVLWGGHFVVSSVENRDNKSFALILSFLFPGIGILYLGNLPKGLTIFFVTVILVPLRIYSSFGLMFSVLSFLIWLYGLYATNMEYKKLYG